MINNIFVKSRKEMEERLKTLRNPSVLISIRDVGGKPLSNHTETGIFVPVLYLEFEDWDKENDFSIVMTDADAIQIASFVKLYHSKNEDIDLYVNCEAGQSRSAGVAAAISKALFDDDEVFFRTKHPNMLCYRKVYNALMEELGEK